MAENGETQIAKGRDFAVSDREITFAGGAIAIDGASAPRLDNTSTKTTVLPTLLTVAAVLFILGIALHFPLLWIGGLALAAFSPVLKINRPAFALSVETGGARKVVYTTAKEQDAKLALAAVNEAQRRANEGKN
ncbi:MAG: hypothetical protein KF779_02815 [Hyphomonadaceae bacterium]|nr:hypothetical protein [Hyphomonadaceae bacterium]